jgi:mono/diheme cytochrome c family protein
VGLEGPLDLLRNDPATRPAALFAEHCGGCHTPANTPIALSKGPTLDGFASRAWATAMLVNPEADALFARTDIHDMPSQAKRLGPEGIAAVSEYLFSLSIEPDESLAPGERPDTALVAKGSELYHTKCTTCHLGEGDLSETDIADRDAPDLTGWGTRNWIRRQIVAPDSFKHYGRRNTMPAFLNEIGARETEMLVRYVRALRATTAPPPQPRAPRPEPEPEPEPDTTETTDTPSGEDADGGTPAEESSDAATSGG